MASIDDVTPANAAPSGISRRRLGMVVAAIVLIVLIVGGVVIAAVIVSNATGNDEEEKGQTGGGTGTVPPDTTTNTKNNNGNTSTGESPPADTMSLYSGCADADCTSCLENWGPAPANETVTNARCSKVRSFGQRQTTTRYSVYGDDAAKNGYKQRALDKGVPAERVDRASAEDLACYIEFFDPDDSERLTLEATDERTLTKKPGYADDTWHLATDHRFLVGSRDDDPAATTRVRYVTCRKKGLHQPLPPEPAEKCPGEGNEFFATPTCTRCVEGYGPAPAEAAARGEKPCSRPYVRGTEYALAYACDTRSGTRNPCAAHGARAYTHERFRGKYGGNPYGVGGTEKGGASWGSYRDVVRMVEEGDEELVHTCPQFGDGWGVGVVCARQGWIPPGEVETAADTAFREQRPLEHRSDSPTPRSTWNAASESDRDRHTRYLCEDSVLYSRQADQNNMKWLPIVEEEYGQVPLVPLEAARNAWDVREPSQQLQENLFYRCEARTSPYNRWAFRKMCADAWTTPHGQFPLHLSSCPVNCDNVNNPPPCTPGVWPESVRAACCPAASTG